MSPLWKQPCPNSDDCWSPINPAIFIGSPNIVVNPTTWSLSTGFGRIVLGILKYFNN
ncbi:MAG: hypothetical protein MJ233_04360 [Mycoplasmoidaceae bacterium]|nr:hypothetical protein [Mycoplasmoidaceae bacterium]